MDKITMIAVVSLVPAKDNARAPEKKKQESWDSFVESIKAFGIQVPLKVRPVGEKYEIIYGHRRLAALKQLGVETAPCIVVEATDEEAHEIRVVENLQRKDLSPIEEAEQIALLLEDGKNLSEIAARIGKSVSWIYQRAQLLKLEKDILAKLKNRQMHDWTIGALCKLACLPKDVQIQIEETMRADGVIDVGDVERSAEHYKHKLVNAPWSLTDKVIENCCACVVCPKRTGATPELFDLDTESVKKKDECLDLVCWGIHMREHLKVTHIAAPVDKKPVFIHDAYQNEKIDLHEFTPTAPEKQHMHATVLGMNAYQLPTTKEEKKKAIKAIDVTTGKMVDVVIKTSEMTGQTEKLAADGTVVKKSMTDKRAALDLRRWKLLGKRYAEMMPKLTDDQLAGRFGAKLSHVLILMAQTFGVSDTLRSSSKLPLLSVSELQAPHGEKHVNGLLQYMQFGYSFFNGLKYLKKMNPKDEQVLKACQAILGLDEEAEWKQACADIPEPKSWTAKPKDKKGKKQKMKGGEIKTKKE